MPTAQAVNDYLLAQVREIRLPRKLKVGFSNGPANETHATFRDLGFVACADGTFDVYCAGGLGANPKMGVLVDTGVAPRNVLYDVCAMVKTFQEHGNYENRARARTRYLQETLGEDGLMLARAERSMGCGEGEGYGLGAAGLDGTQNRRCVSFASARHPAETAGALRCGIPSHRRDAVW